MQHTAPVWLAIWEVKMGAFQSLYLQAPVYVTAFLKL